MKKKIIAAAVGTALTFGAGVSQAENLFFPFFQSGNGVWSFLELANVNGVYPTAEIHYVWNRDFLNTAAVECEHDDLSGTMTAWDLSQQTVVHPNESGLDLPTDFGDTLSQAQYTLGSPMRGFMIVASREQGDSNGNTFPNEELGESTLNGQMVVVDTTTGLITAYRGMNNPNPAASLYANQGNWDNILTSHATYDLTWYPDPVVATQWCTLVTGRNIDNANNWAGSGTIPKGFTEVYDRDEIPRSGNRDVPITCHAFLSRSDLMTGAQVTHSDFGGYMWAVFAVARNNFSTTPGDPQDSTGILMTKIMTTAELGGVATSSMENAWPNLPY